MTGYLRRFPLFDVLTDDDVALLERVLVVTEHPAGQVLLREGDRAGTPTSAMYLLIEGQVGVAARAPEGGFGVTRTLGPGALFGAVAFLAELPRTATCTASSAVTVARLDGRTITELYRRNVGVHARFQLAVARSLAADLRNLRGLLVSSLVTGDEAELRDRFS